MKGMNGMEIRRKGGKGRERIGMKKRSRERGKLKDGGVMSTARGRKA